MTTAALVTAATVIDTGDKFTAGVVNIGGKFTAAVNMIHVNENLGIRVKN
jgi:hypothetical protein